MNLSMMMAIQIRPKLYLSQSVSSGRMGGLASSNDSMCPSPGFENTLVMCCYLSSHAQYGIFRCEGCYIIMHPTLVVPH